ncbi:hypothetical protein DXF85_19585 [Citrobacter pasteurii]|uniref:Uncharacterized protein n=1 Tax=Citrobacter pasteurii TaxID=1563222 RepID=A0A6N6K0M5_9ENTR|nr:hypothetical protein DXF85_19585 [Citrobacter pasteurii]
MLFLSRIDQKSVAGNPSIEPHIITSVSGANFEGPQTLTTQRKNLLSIYNNHVTCLSQQYHACLLCFLLTTPANSPKV